MEIVFGAIGNSQVLPHSLFFFRSENSYKNIPKNKLALLRDECSSSPQQKIKATKLKTLKQRIKDTCIANNYENNLFEVYSKLGCREGNILPT
ncbi:hypothetical protein [Bacteroides faecalis]|uniref:Uncharacterized protein n=1 Tax=Bacteroides faecalis TaxID=2447885 RepID=A0A401LNF9_9BACE|nr:hypothetical protein [Bacteroides faecalis]GCB33068.1 hypothetical protein KGMB02408_00130 [Bacteroides faecalis]